MIAVGGFHEVQLRTCEQYSVTGNKWKGLAPLNTARQHPGSILLKPMKVFCFCGYHDEVGELNSIERIELGCEEEWKAIPLDGRVERTFQLAGVEF